MSVKLARAIVRQQPYLAGSPLLAMVASGDPKQVELALPVLVRSTLEYRELQRMVPESAKQIARVSREVAKHKMGYYDGRS